MQSDSDQYLKAYDSILKNISYRGIGGFVRKKLDNKAFALGQTDRHSLFFKRTVDIMKLNLENIASLRVLSVGCAKGLEISYSHPKIKYYAVDRNDFFRDELEQRGILFQEVDVETHGLPYPDNFFDIIVLNHLIEHIQNYDFFILELCRVLSKHGILYVRTPNIKRVGFSFFDDFTHIKPYSREGLNQLMRCYGLQVVHMFYSDHARINLDILTAGKLRNILLGPVLGGAELEAFYLKK